MTEAQATREDMAQHAREVYQHNLDHAGNQGIMGGGILTIIDEWEKQPAQMAWWGVNDKLTTERATLLAVLEAAMPLLEAAEKYRQLYQANLSQRGQNRQVEEWAASKQLLAIAHQQQPIEKARALVGSGGEEAERG